MLLERQGVGGGMETELREMSQCVHTRTLEVIAQSATYLDTHTHIFYECDTLHTE